MNRPTSTNAACSYEQEVSPMQVSTTRSQRPSVLIVDGVPARGGGGSASS